jgi:hypothetical protein
MRREADDIEFSGERTVLPVKLLEEHRQVDKGSLGPSM